MRKDKLNHTTTRRSYGMTDISNDELRKMVNEGCKRFWNKNPIRKKSPLNTYGF